MFVFCWALAWYDLGVNKHPQQFPSCFFPLLKLMVNSNLQSLGKSEDAL